jgi:FAD/FMN-containing dehydrogenase
VLARYARELEGSERLTGNDDANLWMHIREFTSDYLKRQPGGIVLRVSTAISDLHAVFRLVSGAAIARAASGVTYVYLNSWHGVASVRKGAAEHGWECVVEYAPDELRDNKELWLLKSKPEAVNAFVMMGKVKQMFDPNNSLNRLRLYGRI